MPETIQRLNRRARAGADRWLVAWACLSLLAAQVLGLWHAYAHARGPASAPVHAAAPAFAPHGALGWVSSAGPVFGYGHPGIDAGSHAHLHGGDCAHGHGPKAGHGLDFGHESGSVECRLLDQLLGHADLLVAALPTVPLALPQRHPPAAGQALRRAASLLGYQARAPPPAGIGPLRA